jgi:hypothetical protein
MSVHYWLSTAGSWAGSAAGLLTIPGSLELGVVTLAGFLPTRKPKPGVGLGGGKIRLAVVIPAHNERDSIGRCLASIMQCTREAGEFRVFVIADNCTDETAAIARAAGAEVLERKDETQRGKGHALFFAFSRLMGEPFDAFLVIDADTTAEAGVLDDFARAFARGAEALQCSYRLADAEKWPLLDLANRGFNVVRLRGRWRLGLSAGILGNGFALSRRTLERVPYTAGSIVEDVEYHLSLVRAGIDVEYLQPTIVRGATPVADAGRASQRARWEGGRLGLVKQNTGWLAREVLRGRLRFVELLIDLLTPPIAFQVLLLIVAAALPSTFGRAAALGGFVVLLLHVGAAIANGDSVANDLRTLARTPIYVFWKLKQVPRIIRASGGSMPWVRTAREGEAKQHA